MARTGFYLKEAGKEKGDLSATGTVVVKDRTPKNTLPLFAKPSPASR